MGLREDRAVMLPRRQRFGLQIIFLSELPFRFAFNGTFDQHLLQQFSSGWLGKVFYPGSLAILSVSLNCGRGHCDNGSISYPRQVFEPLMSPNRTRCVVAVSSQTSRRPLGLYQVVNAQ